MMVAPNVTIHDRSGLLLPSSPAPSDEDINQAELIGIAKATDWAKGSRLSPRESKFWQRLHKEMFGDVWRWAGQWRQYTSNIGVAPHKIQTGLRKLQDDLAFWISDQCDMAPLEIHARFHYRLVFIHPFPNGNGRWGRLMTDVLAFREFGLRPFVWAINDDDLRNPNSAERKEYVAAIKMVDDNRDFGPLLSYLKKRNPELQ